MNLAIIGYGLVRGREPEFGLLASKNDVRLIGYDRRKKMHESGMIGTEKIEIVYPEIRPAVFLDPIFALRKEYDCSSWIYFTNLEEYLRDRDVVITHELWNFPSFQAAKICKRLRLPLVAVIFETIPKNPAFTLMPPYSRNTRQVMRTAKLFVAQTNKAKSYLRSLGINEESIRVIYPGIDLDLFRPSPKKKNREEVRILFVGNFVQKGLQTVLKAFIELSKKHHNVSLWIAGNGPKRIIDTILFLQKKFPLRYLGTVPHNEMAPIYREADIFCTLSRDVRRLGIKINEEQFGFALVEAMACGLPIVTTDCGAIPEVVGRGNYVIGQGLYGDLIDALSTLANDSGKRETAGNDNRRRAETCFDVKKQSAVLMQQISSWGLKD